MAQREAGAGGKRKPAAKKKAAKKAAKKTANGAQVPEADVAEGSNFRPPSKIDHDLFLKFAKNAEAQCKIIKKREADLQSEKQALGQIYRNAKEAGVPADRVRQLKKTLKERLRDPLEVLAEEQERYWQHVAMKSEHAKVLPFDSLLAPPSLEVIEAQGEKAGASGESSDNNPWTPGTPQHQSWRNGHAAGQKKSAEGVFNRSSDDGGEGTEGNEQELTG